jgi:hypothetical protein
VHDCALLNSSGFCIPGLCGGCLCFGLLARGNGPAADPLVGHIAATSGAGLIHQCRQALLALLGEAHKQLQERQGQQVGGGERCRVAIAKCEPTL